MATISGVGRPETISCTRCNAVVAVKARGPVPSYCADCRKSSNRRTSTRPTHVACELCGAFVTVKARGPLPKRCRGGCIRAVEPAAKPGPALPARATRPWDKTDGAPLSTPPAAVPGERHEDRAPATAQATGPVITRIDRTHPVTVVGAADIGRRVRVQQFRHAAAITLWLLVIGLIVAVVFIGSQPAAPDF